MSVCYLKPVTFDGWGEKPFTASAAKRVRIFYRGGGTKEFDFTAEALPGGEVRMLPVGRPALQGGRMVVQLGGRAAPDVVADVSIERKTK